MALANLEVKAQNAQALSNLYAEANAPVPGYDENWRAAYASPGNSVEL
jgi:hypothetical protein